MTRDTQPIQANLFEEFAQRRGMRFSPDQIELIDLGWAAGFFDGEGHAGSSDLSDLENQSPKVWLEIKQSYGNLGHYNLLRFQQIVGAGSISEPKTQGNPNAKDYRIWRARSSEDVNAVLYKIGPHLGPAKFEQMTCVFTALGLRAVRSEVFETPRQKEYDKWFSVEVPTSSEA